jgi:hypothetical protein
MSDLQVYFTGVYDTDRKIINELDDNDLFSVCSSTKYTQKLCSEDFWKKRFIEKYGVNLGKYANDSYKNIYRRLSNLSIEDILNISIDNGYLPLVDEYLHQYPEYEYKSIIRAISHGNIEIFKLIWNLNPHILSSGVILSDAARNNRLDILEYLSKEIPDILDDYPDTIARNAAHAGSIKIFEFLKTRGFNILDSSYAYLAAQGNNLPFIKWLEKQGADIFTFDILSVAIQNSNTKLLKYLLKHHKWREDQIRDLTIEALRHNLYNPLVLLLEYGINIKKDDYLFFRVALGYGNAKIRELFVDYLLDNDLRPALMAFATLGKEYQ